MSTSRTSFSNAKIIVKHRVVESSDVKLSDWKDDVDLNQKLFNMYVTEENFLKDFTCNHYYGNELVRF